MVKCLPEFEYFYCYVFLKNKNIIFKIRSKVTDYAGLNPLKNKTNPNKIREIYSDYLFKSLLITIQVRKREN